MPHRKHTTRTLKALAAAIATATSLAITTHHAAAQTSRSVFIDDSPTAAEALGRAAEINNIGNHAEAAEVIARLIKEHGDRLTPLTNDGRATSIRNAAHNLLLNSDELLDAYRTLERAAARATLDAGLTAQTERDHLLTPAGFEAALAIAQQHLQAARFASAYLTIEQLDRHPDRTKEGARRAARLLAQIAAYAGTNADERPDPALAERIKNTLERWQRDADLPKTPPPDNATPPPTPTIRHILSAAPDGTTHEGVLERPLASAQISGDPGPQNNPATARRITGRAPQPAQTPVAPALWEDLLILNTGITVSARHRLSLEEAWSITPTSWSAGISRGRLPTAETLHTVAVTPSTVVAVAGSSAGNDARERVVLAINPANGNIRWNRTLWDIAQSIPPEDARRLAGSPEANEPGIAARNARFFQGAVLQGTPIVTQDTVVLTAVRQVVTERLLSITLLGLDLHNGELKWVTPLGSAGLERWTAGGTPTHIPEPTAGLVIQSSDLGITAAVEASNGRVRWLRATDARESFRNANRAEPFAAKTPVTIRNNTHILENEASALTAIDRWTGETQRSDPASLHDRPSYLLRAGNTLLTASPDGIAAANNNPNDQQPASLQLLDFDAFNAQPLGRAFASETHAFVPTDRGLLVTAIPTDLTKPTPAEPTLIPLRNPGHTLATPTQLFTVQAGRVHAFSSWNDARQALTERMRTAPTDPRPAITFAQLAVQAGKTAEIIPAVDRSIDAIEQDPLDPSMDDARAALFRAILTMLGAEPAPNTITQDTVADTTTRGLLTQRLIRIAGNPAERAAALIATAEHLAATDQHQLAIERYQSILEDTRLATAPASPTDPMPSTAGVRASRAIAATIAAQGNAVIQPLAARANADLQNLLAQTQPHPRDAESLAQRFPLDHIAGPALAVAAALYTQENRPALAANALQHAADARRATTPDTRNPLSAVNPTAARALRDWTLGTTHLEARRVEALASLNRTREAANLANQITRTAPPHPTTTTNNSNNTPNAPEQPTPNITITLESAPLTPAQAAEELDRRAFSQATLPALGTNLTQGPTLFNLAADTLPAGRLPGAPATHTVTTDNAGAIAVFASTRRAPARRWARQLNESPLAFDRTRLYLTAAETGSDARNRAAIARDLDTGEERWRTPFFNDLFDGEPHPNADLNAATPGRIPAPLATIEYRFGARTLLLVETAGRIAAIDLETGNPRWTTHAPLDVIHDTDARAGFTAVVGSTTPRGLSLAQARQPEDRIPHLVIIETATGNTIRSVPLNATPAWTTVAADATVIVGTDQGVLAFEPRTGALQWKTQGQDLAQTPGAVALPSTLLVRDAAQDLWAVHPATGSILAGPADLGDVMDRGFNRATLTQIGDLTAITSQRGTALLDQNAQLVGLADTPTSEPTLRAAFANDTFITITQNGEPTETNAGSAYLLTVRELPSAKLLANAEVILDAPPTRLSAINDWILITTPKGIACVHAPR